MLNATIEHRVEQKTQTLARQNSSLKAYSHAVAHELRRPLRGFHMQDADRLFEPFQRLHSTAEYDGLGIGLATVQQIIERHHGRIWATGSPGKGATFFFTLQRAN